MKLLLKIFTAIAVCATIVSCANYQLAGSGRPLPFDSLCVVPVKNVSYAPQASSLLTNAVITQLSQIPDLTLENANDAQAVLEIKLINYKKQATASQEGDTALAAAYTVELTASCTLRNLRTGETIFSDRKVCAKNMIYTLGTGNLVNEEYQNMPILTRELANKIKDTVIGIW